MHRPLRFSFKIRRISIDAAVATKRMQPLERMELLERPKAHIVSMPGGIPNLSSRGLQGDGYPSKRALGSSMEGRPC